MSKLFQYVLQLLSVCLRQAAALINMPTASLLDTQHGAQLCMLSLACCIADYYTNMHGSELDFGLALAAAIGQQVGPAFNRNVLPRMPPSFCMPAPDTSDTAFNAFCCWCFATGKHGASCVVRSCDPSETGGRTAPGHNSRCTAGTSQSAYACGDANSTGVSDAGAYAAVTCSLEDHHHKGQGGTASDVTVASCLAALYGWQMHAPTPCLQQQQYKIHSCGCAVHMLCVHEPFIRLMAA